MINETAVGAGRPELFDYDAGVPMRLTMEGERTESGSRVIDARYRGVDGRTVKAYLVEPADGAPSFSILFVHPGPGDRTSFLDDALALSKAGGASLLVEAPWADPQFGPRLMGLGIDGTRELFINTAIDLRRGVDAIVSRYDIDVAFVGHSFGALFGGILSAVEPRFKAFVLMAGVGSFTYVAQANVPQADPAWLKAYTEAMGPIDPIHYIGGAHPTPLLFQFGLEDHFFPRQLFEDFFRAGSEPKEIMWYKADHYSLNQEGRGDRAAWLVKKMGHA